MLVPAVQPIVYQAEQPDDKIFAGHGARTSQLEAGHSQSEIPPWPSCQLAPVVSYGRKSGPKAGSRASSPGEQAAACDCQKTRPLGREQAAACDYIKTCELGCARERQKLRLYLK